MKKQYLNIIQKYILIFLVTIVVLFIYPISASARDPYVNCYWYSVISDKQQEIYKKAYEHKDDIKFEADAEAYSLNDINTGLQAFLMDFPECQYQEMKIDSSAQSHSVHFVKSVARPEEVTDQSVSELAKKVTAKDEYMKIKQIHDIVCNHLIYAGFYSTNLYDAAVRGESRCGGYSKLFQVICRKTGVTCITVYGTTENGYHGWNIVKTSRGWYEVDTTYDDTHAPIGYYGYFLKTRSEMEKNGQHKILLDPTILWNSETQFYPDLIEAFPKIENKSIPQIDEEVKGNDGNYYIVRSFNDAYFSDYTKKQAKVKIPNRINIHGNWYNVTGIADSAFWKEKKIKKVVYTGKNRSGNFTIEKSAFYGCKNLKKIDIRKAGQIKQLEKGAFEECNLLESITVDKKTSSSIKKKIKNIIKKNK